MTEAHRIVFLDRDSVIATIRKPSFAHEWTEHPATAHADAAARLRGARATIAITNKVKLRAEDLAQLPELKMIAVAATGTDIVDLAAARERGIVVSNIRNYAVHTLPEHTFALMLALRRQLVAYRADIEAGLWQKSERFCLFGHPIADLAGSRLGLFGYGALGRSVAQIARAFGMEVVVHTRSPLPDAKADGVREASFDEVLETSDIISLHLPLTDKTRNMIGARELIRMKRSALLINNRARRPGRRDGAGRRAAHGRDRRRRLRRAGAGAAAGGQRAAQPAAAELHPDTALGLGQHAGDAGAGRSADRQYRGVACWDAEECGGLINVQQGPGAPPGRMPASAPLQTFS